MSKEANLIAGYLILLLVYWAGYFWTRTHVLDGRRFHVWTFVGMLGVLLFMIFPYQMWIFGSLELDRPILYAAMLGMGLASILHHMSIVARHTRFRKHLVEEVHGPVSHLVFFGAYAVTFSIVAPRLAAETSGGWEAVVLGLYILFSVVMVVSGILIGVGKLKLPYR